MVSDLIFDLEEQLTQEKKERKCVKVFQKALITFSIFKTGILWYLADAFLSGAPPKFGFSLHKLASLPSLLAALNPTVFFALTIIVLVVMLFITANHFTNTLLFWINLNLLVIRYPVTNGSDYVLVALSLYNIFLTFTDFYDPRAEILDNTAFNIAHFLARVQIILVYLISGWDKMFSNVWTSGDAFQYIGKMETVFNPSFGNWVTGSAVSFTLSWITILFEIGFGLLVWKKVTRLPLLVTGIIFHIVIWIMLSLPDFAAIMILSYLLFLKDADLKRLPEPVRRWLV